MQDLPPGKRYPRSPYDMECGLVYFPRMLDKIRLYAAGALPEDYVPYLSKGFDGRCTRFLGVKYEALLERVQAGDTDGEIFQWCISTGRQPNTEEIEIWNSFMTKRGWRELDPAVEGVLEEHKASVGLSGRDDILTFFDFQEVDEGRKA